MQPAYPPAVDTWEALLKEVVEWADKTFGNTRKESSGKAKHLEEEARELHEAIKDGDYRKISNELADIIIIAIHCASIEGIDLLEAVRHKFEIVKKREWLPPDADGVIRHVK